MMPFWVSLVLTVTLFCSSYLYAAKTSIPPLMHSHLYKAQSSITSYLVSEKLDGVRAYWDGSKLITRAGNVIEAPEWFLDDFPEVPLDGELWLGRGQFDRLSGIVRSKSMIKNDWQQVTYQVFDLPDSKAIFAERYKDLESLLKLSSPLIQLVKQYSFQSEDTFELHFQKTVDAGGEGLMLHNMASVYSAKRSRNLLKYKPVFDAEAKIIGITEGAGKYEGFMGALIVKMEDGREFKIGSGFTTEFRQNPPLTGELITFEYSGLTSTGLPRFARFKRMYKP